MNVHRPRAVAVALALLGLLHACGKDGSSASPSAKADWPLFHQNLQHTGLSPIATENDIGSLKWNFMTGGQVESSPALGADGTIYV